MGFKIPDPGCRGDILRRKTVDKNYGKNMEQIVEQKQENYWKKISEATNGKNVETVGQWWITKHKNLKA